MHAYVYVFVAVHSIAPQLNATSVYLSPPKKNNLRRVSLLSYEHPNRKGKICSAVKFRQLMPNTQIYANISVSDNTVSLQRHSP